MATVTERFDLVAGFYVIERASLLRVTDIAAKWRSARHGNRFVHLTVRDCTSDRDRASGKSRVTIDFAFELITKEPAKEREAFEDVTTDELKKAFGNGLVQWSTSNPVTQISA